MRWLSSLAVVALLGLAAGCGDGGNAGPKDAGPTEDAPPTPPIDASPDAPPDGPGALGKACLDQPSDLVPRPPTQRLPCELIPPGM